MKDLIKMRKIEVIPKKELTWSQASQRYPKIKLNPFGDADKDGVKNWVDCKPFDKKKQDEILHLNDTLIKKGNMPNRRVQFNRNNEDEFGFEVDLGIFRSIKWKEFEK
jgi:hypothetical protein